MSTRRRRSVRPSPIEVAKDLILFAVGLWLIIQQGVFVPKAEFNWWAMVFGIGLTQAPGAMKILSFIRTDGQSSPDPPLQESLPLPSSLPSAPVAELEPPVP